MDFPEKLAGYGAFSRAAILIDEEAFMVGALDRAVFGLAGVFLFLFAGTAIAAPQSYSSSSGGPAAGRMYMDVGVQYVRDTKPDGPSDTAGRFSVGGMFNEWIGLDGLGMFEGRSKDYLVGADLRLAPIDWFFIKAGAGAYSEKDNNTLNTTPILGAGIMVHLSRDFYFVTESSYFSVNTHDNVTFGVGLGTTF